MRSKVSRILCASLLGACAAESPLPVVDSVEPAKVSNDSESLLLVHGRSFFADIYVEAGNDSRSSLNSNFRLTLATGERFIPLSDVELVSRVELRARLPAGAPVGSYALELRDPRGRRAEPVADALYIFDGPGAWRCEIDSDCANDPCVVVPICESGYCLRDRDADEDEYVDAECGGDDCDDASASIHPGAEETVADGVDQDCDGNDLCFMDADGDGFGDGLVIDTDLDCRNRSVSEAPVGGDCDDVPFACGADCFPDNSAADLCDGRDQDCDGSIDEDPELVWYHDADGDGYTNNGDTLNACFDPDGADSAWVAVPTADDCDDDTGACGANCYPTNPVADVCDGHNQDCDGSVDEDPEVIWYHDADSDGYTKNDDTQNACSDPDGAGINWVAAPTDDDCADTPGSDPACNNLDGLACNPGLAGVDGCDGADNDCDSVTDEDMTTTWYHDADGDGYTNIADTQMGCADPDGTGTEWVGVPTAQDCADDPISDPGCDGLPGASCNPGLADADGCDGADNDCDGSTDEDPELVWYHDADGDGYTNNSDTQNVCSDPDGSGINWVAAATADDCDDNIAGCGAGCYPTNPTADVCDGDNQDCDGSVDEDPELVWFHDADGDGYTNNGDALNACSDPDGAGINWVAAATANDCDDDIAGCGAGCYPTNPAADICDGDNQDCDGSTDEDPELVWYHDADGDGYTKSIDTQNACSDPDGAGINWVATATTNDCDDDTAGCGAGCYPTNPAADVCDGDNQDCDGSTDEDPELVWYHDADGDGYTNNGDTQSACSDPDGSGINWVAAATADDCADTPGSDPACNGLDGDLCSPGVIEAPGTGNCADGADNDCDTLVDGADPVCAGAMPPIADLVVAPTVGYPATLFDFDASGSTDNEDPVALLEARWDWENDGTWDTGWSPTKTATHSFGSTGSFTILVEVRDTDTMSDYASGLVTVSTTPTGSVVVTTAVDENNGGATPAAPGGTGLSLREAIGYANGTGQNDEITFSGPMTINLSSTLPAINSAQALHIKGRTGVVIDGSGFSGDCLLITSDDNSIAELRFEGCMAGPILVNGTANVLGSVQVDGTVAGETCIDLNGDNNTLIAVEVTSCGNPAVTLDGSNNSVAYSILNDNEFGIEISAGTTGSVVGPGCLISGTYQDALNAYAPVAVRGSRFESNQRAIGLRDGSSGSVIEMSTSWSTTEWGVWVEGTVSGVTVRHTTLDGNGDAGLMIGSGSGNGHDLRNNIFSNNGTYGIDAEAAQIATLDFNNYYNNPDGSCKSCTPGTNAKTVDPDFAGRPAGDLRLLLTSSLVDAALDLGADVNGPTPGLFNGLAPDIGAWESPGCVNTDGDGFCATADCDDSDELVYDGTVCDDAIACTERDTCSGNDCRGYDTASCGTCDGSCSGGCGANNCCVQTCSGSCPTCEPGCSCDQQCTSTGCDMDCSAGAICHLDQPYADQANTTVTCTDATCLLDCPAGDQGSCRIDCTGDSICVLDCSALSDASSSCQLDCNASAACEIRCHASLGSCQMDGCAPTNCGGGAYVCNRPCP